MNGPVLWQEIIKIEQDEVFTIAVRPDGQTLVSTNSQGVTIWDAMAGQEHMSLSDEWVIDVAYSPDGKTLAGGTFEGEIILWDAATGRERMRWVGHPGEEGGTQGVTSLRYSPDGQLIASGGNDRTIKLWAADAGELLRVMRGHTGYITSLAFSPDSLLLASGSMVEDNTLVEEDSLSDSLAAWHTDAVVLWDMVTGAERKRLVNSAGINALTFSPDGRVLASGNDDATVNLWNVGTWEVLTTLRGHTQAVRSAAFSPDGTLFASGGGKRDRSIRLWDVATWRMLMTNLAHQSSVISLAFSPDGKSLASASENEIKIWLIR